MFIGEKLLYLELPKTGCSHVRRLLLGLPSCTGRLFGKHNRIYRLPPEELDRLDAKIVFGNVRNPWDWYVSLWAFGRRRKGMVYANLTGDHRRPDPEPPAAAAQWRAVYQTDEPELFRRWLHMLLDSHRADVRLGFHRHELSKSVGLLTHRYVKLYTATARSGSTGVRDRQELERFDERHGLLDFFIRTEHLEDDLIGVLSRVPITDEERDLIERSRSVRSNRSARRRDYREYYDDTAAELVAGQDDYLIAKHGYRFDMPA
jgi:hypothetical protein